MATLRLAGLDRFALDRLAVDGTEPLGSEPIRLYGVLDRLATLFDAGSDAVVVLYVCSGMTLSYSGPPKNISPPRNDLMSDRNVRQQIVAGRPAGRLLSAGVVHLSSVADIALQ